MEDDGKTKVLFICLGNICRSPMAEWVMKHLVQEKGVADKWYIESAALGSWHVGNKGDRRMLAELKKNNVPAQHKARQIKQEDFDKFDLIIGMDHDNMHELEELKRNDSKAELKLFGEYDPQGELIIRDPYYDSDTKGFEKVYTQCVRCSEGLLKSIKK